MTRASEGGEVATVAAPGSGVGAVRVGVDLIAVADVATAIDHWGERYLQRLFTAAELSDTTGPARAARLAARFAAKEATIKALAPTGEPPTWRSIEVRQATGGACRLELHERALELAEEAGIDAWSLALTHEGPMAAAVVAASTLTAPDRTARQEAVNHETATQGAATPQTATQQRGNHDG